MMIFSKAKGLSWGIASMALCSCHNSSRDHQEQKIQFAVVSGEGGTGLSLNIKNLTSSSICIPTSTITADSGSVTAYREGKEYSSPNNTEYSAEISGVGPFYIVSNGSSVTLPIAEGGLKLKDGKYLVRASIVWIKCSRLVSGKSYASADFEKTVVQSPVLYEPFQ